MSSDDGLSRASIADRECPEDGDAGLRIGVVVVAYRSAATIEDCLRSCLRDQHVVAVVVHDNSRDAQTQALVTRLGDRRLTYLPNDNVGFAAGCNRGAERLPDVDWLAFVNPDVRLDRTLAELVECARRCEVSLLGANVPTPGQPLIVSARDGVTRRRELAKAVLGTHVYSKTKAALQAGPSPVDQVSGALMMLPRDEFATLGGFDEQFELYYEDVDICTRATARHGCYFVAEDWGSHLGGASSAGVSGMAFAVGRVSRMRYLRKHRPGLLTELVLFLIGPVELLARSVKGTREGGRARWGALAAQWREWRKPGSVLVLR